MVLRCDIPMLKQSARLRQVTKTRPSYTGLIMASNTSPWSVRAIAQKWNVINFPVCWQHCKWLARFAYVLRHICMSKDVRWVIRSSSKYMQIGCWAKWDTFCRASHSHILSLHNSVLEATIYNQLCGVASFSWPWFTWFIDSILYIYMLGKLLSNQIVKLTTIDELKAARQGRKL